MFIYPCRRKKWLEVIGRPDLMNTKPTSNCVCSLHFEKSMIKNIPQLNAEAVPTKLLPNQPSTSNQGLHTGINKGTTFICMTSYS